ncbi:hypothetical protein F4778DRAFT_375187 [Xylariomycetidae sp. FL2044]|nr:hypothetical protein F4778DRAFT_375187 [Xylariomycetidae sp. FL2044]
MLWWSARSKALGVGRWWWGGAATCSCCCCSGEEEVAIWDCLAVQAVTQVAMAATRTRRQSTMNHSMLRVIDSESDEVCMLAIWWGCWGVGWGRKEEDLSLSLSLCGGAQLVGGGCWVGDDQRKPARSQYSGARSRLWWTKAKFACAE